MADDRFREQLLTYFDELKTRVVDENGAWTVKGFIDIYRRVYTISLDTKVLSKVLELLMFPVLARFARENHYQIVLARAQNQYPDLTLIALHDESLCYAIDIKTTYHTGKDQQGNRRISGMTLGTFGGHFRARDRIVSSTLPYNRYLRHYVLGVVYTRNDNIDEQRVYSIDELEQIPSVASNFEFFFHEKYRIASDQPGSGNTRNIGSTHFLDRLLEGKGVFAELGIEVFDDYWMNYRTRAMAREEGLSEPPYTSLLTYRDYKSRGAQILAIPPDMIQTETDDPPNIEPEA